jgi:tetratricopeptide (TPR) repeat protein
MLITVLFTFLCGAVLSGTSGRPLRQLLTCAGRDHQKGDDKCLKRTSIQEGRERQLLDRIAALEVIVSRFEQKLDNLKLPQVDLHTLEEPLKRVETAITETSRKVPPIATTIASAAIVFVLLGLQFKDIMSARQSITDLSKPVSIAVDELKKGTEGSKEISVLVQKSLDKLNMTVSQGQELLSKYNDLISGSLSKVSGIEGKVAKLSTEINLLIEQIDTGSTKITGQKEDDSIANSETLIEALINAGEFDGKTNPVALLARAHATMKRGDYKEARRLAMEAKSRGNSEKESVFDVVVAQSYHLEGKYKEAIGAWEKALDIGDTTSTLSILNNLGASYFAWAQQHSKDSERQKELLKKASEYGERACNMTQDNSGVYVNQSVTLNALGESGRALQTLESYKGEVSPNIDYQFAATYALLGRKGEAIERLSQSLKGGTVIAIKASLDDDFKCLRSDADFKRVLSIQLSPSLIEKIEESWLKDTEK